MMHGHRSAVLPRMAAQLPTASLPRLARVLVRPRACSYVADSIAFTRLTDAAIKQPGLSMCVSSCPIIVAIHGSMIVPINRSS